MQPASRDRKPSKNIAVCATKQDATQYGDREWQIKRDRYVAICPGPYVPLEGEHVYYDSFRGFHYFDLDSYRDTLEARIPI